MTEIKVPNVGESITEVTIASWLKNDGDYVEMDEALAELESDKATFELNAETAGTLSIQVNEGEDVNVGDVVCSIDESAEAPAESDSKEETTQVEEKQEEAQPAATQEKEVSQEETTYATGVASPAASKLMEEHGLSSSQITGSGKDGRITKQDVQDAIDQQKKEEATGQSKENGEPAKEEKEATPSAQPQPQPQATEPTPSQEPQTPFSRDERREKMSRLRRTVSKRLVEVKNNTAMLTTFNDVDMSAIQNIRQKYKDKFKDNYNVNLGFMSFFIKACCVALKQWPSVNAKIEGEEIVFHDYCDVSIAVSTPRGLVVPVIRNAESLSMAELEAKVVDLAKRARDNKLGLEEMQGGTFSITNGGVFGSMLSTPIINGDQSAILGMHRVDERPVAIDGKVEIRPMMYVALSYDHRLVDGKESVSFLRTVKELLENPADIYTEGNAVKKLLGM